ncbi:hypothetical protein GCM10010285_02750 [Streptomyces pseudogriseolus]|uniref:Uncharacterized protein n=1 Tax=Streptomyces pseudogriseolus TaxID=36817 RepID=A0ABQ2SJ34_STREZ|nr:hypothetical protein GCM10010285_02750 [Streptomyces rubiginosus]
MPSAPPQRPAAAEPADDRTQVRRRRVRGVRWHRGDGQNDTAPLALHHPDRTRSPEPGLPPENPTS